MMELLEEVANELVKTKQFLNILTLGDDESEISGKGFNIHLIESTSTFDVSIWINIIIEDEEDTELKFSNEFWKAKADHVINWLLKCFQYLERVKVVYEL